MIDSSPKLALHPGLTTAQLLAGLGRRDKARRRLTESADQRAGPFRLAAAVLHVYHPGTLRPVSGASGKLSGESLNLLSSPAIGWRDKLYRTLDAEVRIATLRQLGTRKAMREALAANPQREMTTVQRLFEAWLDDRLRLEELNYGELEELRQLYAWELEAFGGLPARADLDRARAHRASVAIFEHLVDSSFVGRTGELQRLRDYVGVVDPSTWAKLRAFLRRGASAPLVIYGPGGIGKTAMIGRFLMEHVESPDIGWFPFAYLAFDSETLDVRQPWTLLRAAADQLATQVAPRESETQSPEVQGAFDDFAKAVVQFRDRKAKAGRRATVAASQSDRATEGLGAEDNLYRSFGSLLTVVANAAAKRQDAGAPPVLMVFDTFEEVVYRTDEDLRGLWRMLTRLQEAFSDLRVIISGRIQPRPFEVGGNAPDHLDLEDLSEADAKTLLQLLGVGDDSVCAGIVRQIGRNPLTLRLAARAARDEALGSDGFEGLQTKRFWIANVAPEIVRGQLYRRILDHIHDPDVVKLAHPGMALRRLTADLIRRVLAPNCGLGEVNMRKANKLFEALRREHVLVRLAEDNSLRYREDVRTPMLGLMASDDPALLERLHDAAIAYYAARPGGKEEERAEELYHRLMRGQAADQLEPRWLPGVERYLGSAIEEIPDDQKIWLASHMSIELPRDVYAIAEIAQWERIVGGKALELARYGEPQQILALLSERAERSAESPLFAIEIRARMNLGLLDEAAEISRRAAQGWTMKNPGRLAEILWLGAQAARQSGDLSGAVEILVALSKLSERLKSKLPQVQALAELVPIVSPEELAGVRTKLAAALDRLSDSEVDSERSLVRLACARLGDEYPCTLRRVLPIAAMDLPLLVGERPSILDALPRAFQLISGVDPDLPAGPKVSPSEAPRIANRILDLVHKSPTQAKLSALLTLVAAEQTDLAAATLAGLDVYREDFELRAAPEAAS